MDKAAIVIVHYKGDIDTKQCLSSILINHSKNKEFKIIVVVNPFTESKLVDKKISFARELKSEFPQVIVIETNTNTGFSKGNNIGIRKALDLGCDYIVLLNNDTIVTLGLFDKLISFAKSDFNIGLVSPKIYFAKGFEYHQERYKDKEKGKVLWYAGGRLDWDNIYATHRGLNEVDMGQYDDLLETDFATGCCMLLKRKVIEKIGFLDEKYFLYYEDIDYSQRVKKIKMKVVYYPDAFLWHKNASSSGKPGSKLHIYYQNRNRLYFGFKYASAKTKKSLFIDSLRLAAKGGIYTKSILDYYLGRMGGRDI